MTEQQDYLQKYNGMLAGVLKWEDLSRLWEAVRSGGSLGWYVYAIGEPPPTEPVSTDQLSHFITRLDTLLRQDHQESYCGIVYVDNRETPGFVKVYDPNNLGMVCGSSDEPVLPGWTLSLAKPVDLPGTIILPQARRRWWRRLFATR